MKYQAQTFNKRGKPPHSSPSQATAAVNGHGSRSNAVGEQLVKIGDNGEIFISFGNTLEVWDWSPSSLQLRQMETDRLPVDDHEGGSGGLYLVASLTDLAPNDEILDFLPIEFNQLANTYKVLLTLKRDGEIVFLTEKIGQFHEDDDSIETSIILPPAIHGYYPFKIKSSSSKFIGIATNEGSLTVFDQTKSQPLPFNLNVKMLNDDCLFDIQGRFLAYVPADGDDEFNSEDTHLTRLNVPSYNSKSVYSRLVENLSNTALDGISNISHNLQKKNLQTNPSQQQQQQQQHDIKKNLKLYLSSFINGGGSSKDSKSSKVILIDLESQRQIACFKPPNGISNLSLSPYNSHLITINSRGNQIYKWDLTKIPNEIDLIDIQIRGKTSSIVGQIHWYSNNIFQILTSQTGSIHSFFTDSNVHNWILPNLEISHIGRIRPYYYSTSATTTNNNKSVKNSSSSSSSSNNNMIIAKSKFSNDIYLIDLNGAYNLKYQLPTLPIPRSLLPDYIPIYAVKEITIKTPPPQPLVGRKRAGKSSLSQVEIETCVVGEPLVKNRRFEFATYNFKSLQGQEQEEGEYEDTVVEDDGVVVVEDSEKFWHMYTSFGNDLSEGLNLAKVKGCGVGNDGDGDVVFHDDEVELVNAMQCGLRDDN